MRQIRYKSQRRRRLLTRQLGVGSADELGAALGNWSTPAPKAANLYQRRKSLMSRDRFFNGRLNRKQDNSRGRCTTAYSAEISAAKSIVDPTTNSVANANPPGSVSLSTPRVYTDSSTFLKGTQSANPHNDYCQHFVDTGQRPQNFIRDAGRDDRFEEYPKLRELVQLKDELVARTAAPPMFLQADLLEFDLSRLRSRFDVILIEPPLLEYQRALGRVSGVQHFWSWPEIEALRIDSVAAHRAFVFLWCGSADGLDLGRQCLRAWGFRRCEDICWVKTNIAGTVDTKLTDSRSIFRRSKEHCLMGIKGTVRRSKDGDFIHANVDIDLIISEEPARGSLEKPVEIFQIIERFCLGSRRLHLFGGESAIRPGWLTVGPTLTSSNFDADLYNSHVSGSRITTGCTDRIETLRPKSPPAKGQRPVYGRARSRGVR